MNAERETENRLDGKLTADRQRDRQTDRQTEKDWRDVNWTCGTTGGKEELGRSNNEGRIVSLL